eukprot:TRINITY_DN17383_c0_g1_i1.p1 TRINITY_DN17383_c0_g1~~TRINITY_DN17383_c0_g1_i1.p1  ORF type:complete len:353 (-),score=78.35 TRINITY_DN17383_c0_g1_i1:49-1107(-)
MSSLRDAPEEASAAAAEEAKSEDEKWARTLQAKEERLTRPVPNLLETMNRASTELNAFERELDDAQACHRQLLEQLSQSHDELRAHYGNSIDKARPYFEANEALTIASDRARSAIRSFSAASSQHTQAKADLRAVEERLAYGAHQIALNGKQQDALSRATVQVLRTQTERDAQERAYATALHEYQEAQEAAETWRCQVGDSTIRLALPCFRRLQHNQRTLDQEQKHINALVEKAKKAKQEYNHCMNELDRINVAVHEARKHHREMSRRRRPSQPEVPPELVPEVTTLGECCDDMDAEQQALEDQKKIDRERIRALGGDEDDDGGRSEQAMPLSSRSWVKQVDVAGDDDGPFA